MNVLIIVEIVAAIVVLAAAVRFAVRDTRRRSGASLQQPSGSQDRPQDTREVAEREAEQHHSEVADQRDGEEAAAVSVSSTSLEPPADQH
ncbi:MAG: hypothetical protein M3Y48_20070 [Actinomycetota bacterium]|nr:hypothetical protein [Actinomycetota bacterium]